MAAMRQLPLRVFGGLLVIASSRLALCAETNHDFAEREKEIATFEQADRTNPSPKGALFFIGSSIIRLWRTLAQDFPNHRAVKRVFGGSQIADSMHFAERVRPFLPASPGR